MNDPNRSRPLWKRSLCRRLALATLLIAFACGAGAPTARAQWAVIDPAHIAKTVWNGRKIVEQVRKQRDQIRNEIRMLRALPDPPWREINALRRELDGVMRRGEAIAYSMDNLTREFGVTFPGFQEYADWSAGRRRQFDRTLQTYSNVLVNLQRQGQHLRDSHAELQRIKGKMGGAEGQNASIQLGNTIGTFNAEELMLIRQLLATQTNAVAVQSAYRINKEAQEMAQMQKIYSDMANYDHPEGRGYTGILSDDNR